VQQASVSIDRGQAHSLSLKQLTKHYGPVVAADAVDLEVAQGEFITLLGPSGSGKTTLLMMIAGFAQPTAGEILLDGRDITKLPPEKRNFGMVFQGYALFQHMTVAGNVGFPLQVRGRARSEIDGRVARALALVQMDHLAGRKPRQLSGGQQQRVALARAMSFDPDILLLDEPLSALDRKLRTELQVELKALHQQLGKTFLYVTHDQEEALSMSDRIAILRDGRIEQLGGPEDLYERPVSRFVASFLGESNFLSGTVAEVASNGFVYRTEAGVFGQALGDAPAPAAGEPVLIAMRPEKLKAAKARPEGVDNSVQGQLLRWNYLGSSLRLEVAVEGLGRLIVVIPAWQSDLDLGEGAPLWLSWSAEASVVVADR